MVKANVYRIQERCRGTVKSRQRPLKMEVSRNNVIVLTVKMQNILDSLLLHVHFAWFTDGKLQSDYQDRDISRNRFPRMFRREYAP
jgi:hypothetical protein